jgi:polysaccharide export outer membrane protein
VISTRPFYVLGEVTKPGEYPYRAGLTINSAVATAGGFTFRAEQDYIYIQRYGEGAETKIKMSPSVPVFPGDIVRVDNRFF